MLPLKALATVKKRGRQHQPCVLAKGAVGRNVRYPVKPRRMIAKRICTARRGNRTLLRSEDMAKVMIDVVERTVGGRVAGDGRRYSGEAVFGQR
jgi:hypothetical protein